MTPDLGQGACLALEDAAVLARCLADEAEVSVALTRYSARRVARELPDAAFELGQLREPTLCRLGTALICWTPAWAVQRWLSWQFAFEP